MIVGRGPREWMSIGSASVESEGAGEKKVGTRRSILTLCARPDATTDHTFASLELARKVGGAIQAKHFDLRVTFRLHANPGGRVLQIRQTMSGRLPPFLSGLFDESDRVLRERVNTGH